MSDSTWWEQAYKSGRKEATPWEKGEADKYLSRLISERKIPGKRVLDACSGLGTQAIYMAEHGYNVSGIEISNNAVSKALEKSKELGVKVDFRQGNVQNLPFEDATFDFVFDRGCLHHQDNEDLEDYLNETKRVLKPGGWMFIIAFTSRFQTKQLLSLFEDNFNVLEHSIFSEEAADNYIREFHALLLEKKR